LTCWTCLSLLVTCKNADRQTGRHRRTQAQTNTDTQGNDRQGGQDFTMCKVISSWHLRCCQMIQAFCTDLDVSGQHTAVVTSSENISMSSSCDQAAGPQDSLFVQTQDQAHSIESAVITACAQNTVYTLQFLFNTTPAVLLDKFLCAVSMKLSAVFSRSSQLCVVLTEVFTETQVVPNGATPPHKNFEFVFCGGFPHAMRTLMGVGSRLAMA